jgi:hypothetical protein
MLVFYRKHCAGSKGGLLMRPFHLVAATALLLTACDTQREVSPVVAGTPAIHEAEGARTAFSTFTGASGHATSGEVFLVRGPEGYVVSLGSDFALDGAPDPYVSLGDADTAHLNLAPLMRTVGVQVYPVPADIDVGDYDHVYIWCEEFGVPLGSAELEPL